MRRMITTAVSALALTATAVGAQQETTDTQVEAVTDRERGGLGSYVEFKHKTGESSVFGLWGEDPEQRLTYEDFTRGTYDLYDMDRDAELTEEEFVGMQRDPVFGWEGTDEEMAEVYTDRDRGGLASYEEFQARTGQGGVSGLWEEAPEEGLTREEFTRGTFDLYDVDRDEYIDEAEYSAMQRGALFGEPTVKAGGAETVTQD